VTGFDLNVLGNGFTRKITGLDNGFAQYPDESVALTRYVRAVTAIVSGAQAFTNTMASYNRLEFLFRVMSMSVQ
jgi:hypothetical protein